MGASKQTMDFTNVKEGGGRFNKKQLPEGDYRAKIVKVEDAKSKKTDEPMWLYTIEVKHGNQVGTYPHYCLLNEKNLWKLRSLFAACGIVIPKKRVSVDPNKIVGRVIGVTLEDTEYDGKMQSQVVATLPVSEIADEDVPDTDEDDEEEDAEEETEEEEEEPTPPPARKRAAKKAEPEPEPEEDEEDEDDEEEEDAPAPKKRAAKAAAAPKKRGPKPRAATEDDLEELDLDEL